MTGPNFLPPKLRILNALLLAVFLLPRCSPEDTVAFHSLVPLGAEALSLKPGHRTLYLLATADCAEFEGWRQRQAPQAGSHPGVYARDGSPVRYFPSQVGFRITANARLDDMSGVDASPYPAPSDLNEFLLHLRFRLSIFHRLEQTLVEPDAVQMLGVPADLSYDERVWHVSFTLDRVPIDDRVVLEVLSPAGERIGKFHLEF